MKQFKKISILVLCFLLIISFMPMSSLAPVANAASEASSEVQGTEDFSVTSALEKKKADELAYDPLFIMRHGNSKYVNIETIDLQSMLSPVTVARGVATYSEKKQKEFDVDTSSFWGSVNYEVPVYDVDPNSDYYITLPNVNIYRDEIGSFDLDLIYNNDGGENIKGYHFEDNILYIPKGAVDKPQNKYELQSDSSPVAIQLNYYFKSAEYADFSKEVAVQVLKNKTPENLSVKVDNIFATNTIEIPVGKYAKDDIEVMLNGMLLPISKDAYDIENGICYIYSSAAVVSNVNIVVKGGIKSAVSRIVRSLTDSANAVSAANMKYFKTASGKYVTINVDTSKLYVGWRGHYTGADVHYSGMSTVDYNAESHPNDNLAKWKDQDFTNNGERDSINQMQKLSGWKNSVQYMYGPTVPGNAQSGDNMRGIWAIESYTLATDMDETRGQNVLQKNEKISDYHEGTSNPKKTIYEWLLNYIKDGFELNNQHIGGYADSSAGHSNGIGGYTNFGFKFPDKTVEGETSNIVSDPNADGYGKGNISIDFSSPELGSSYYLAAGCTHLDDDAKPQGGNTGQNEINMSCLAIGSDYAVFAFVYSNTGAGSGKQDACAIYKFKTGATISIQKTSAASAITEENSLYSFKDAKFKIYESASDAKTNTDAVATFTAEADGTTNSATVPTDTYYLVETNVPKGYAIPDEYKAENGGKKITVSKNGTFTVKNIPQVGDFELEKLDKETSKAQGDGMLLNAGFLVKYYDGQYATKTAAEASSTATKTWHMRTTDLGDGKYGLRMSDPHHYTGYPAGTEDPAGTESTFFAYSSGRYVAPIGTYVIEEFKAPEGYNLSDEVTIINVKENAGNEPIIETVTRSYEDAVKRGGIRLQKNDDDTNEGSPQGDASLKDAEFTITNRSEQSVRVDGKDYATGEVVKTIITDENGVATTDATTLPYGTYYIEESKESPGYNKDDTFQYPVDDTFQYPVVR